MRPPFNNSFRPQARPQRPQQHQNNGYNQHNGYQNQVASNQLGMMNPQMMSNPMMGHMNNPIRMQPPPPIHPQFYNMPQQQQQLNQFGLPNHINQLLPGLLGNLQFAVANSNLMGHSLPFAQPNFFQPPLNSFNPRGPYPPVPTSHQNHQSRPPGFSEPRPQGQSVNFSNNNNGSSFRGNDFQTNQQKFKGPGQGFQRNQSHQADNGKKRFGVNKNHKGKGKSNKMVNWRDRCNADNIPMEIKISYDKKMYPPQEVRKWHEARRKNYPTKLNVEKKAKRNVPDDEEAKLRRQQLREVLAKQLEMGVEVAEVPTEYLTDGNEQANGDNNGKRGGRFQNTRHNKRRHNEGNKFSKKPRFKDESSSQESNTAARKPSLLEKLLSTDIKREKSQLLQVFRFMVMNSFFKEPEQPLKLPMVMVEETGCEHDREEDPTTDGDEGDEADD